MDGDVGFSVGGRAGVSLLSIFIPLSLPLPYLTPLLLLPFLFFSLYLIS